MYQNNPNALIFDLRDRIAGRVASSCSATHDLICVEMSSITRKTAEELRIYFSWRGNAAVATSQKKKMLLFRSSAGESPWKTTRHPPTVDEDIAGGPRRVGGI